MWHFRDDRRGILRRRPSASGRTRVREKPNVIRTRPPSAGQVAKSARQRHKATTPEDKQLTMANDSFLSQFEIRKDQQIPIAILVTLVVLLIAVYWNTLRTISTVWNTPAYSHGWLVPVFAVVYCGCSVSRFKSRHLKHVGRGWPVGHGVGVPHDRRILRLSVYRDGFAAALLVCHLLDGRRMAAVTLVRAPALGFFCVHVPIARRPSNAIYLTRCNAWQRFAAHTRYRRWAWPPIGPAITSFLASSIGRRGRL